MIDEQIPAEILTRITHLARWGDVYIPGFDREAGHTYIGTVSFLSPTWIYRLPGAVERYLIAVYTDKLWTLVAVDQLACSRFCEDPGCVETRERIRDQWRGVPRDGMIIAAVDVDPKTEHLPRPIPYFVNIDDVELLDTADLPVPVRIGLRFEDDASAYVIQEDIL